MADVRKYMDLIEKKSTDGHTFTVRYWFYHFRQLEAHRALRGKRNKTL